MWNQAQRSALPTTALLVKVVISNDVFGGNISIGQDVSINSKKSFINGCGGVSIGDNTRIGTQSIIIASNHKFDDPDILVKDQITKQGQPGEISGWVPGSDGS